jgi:hypothetical protein
MRELQRDREARKPTQALQRLQDTSLLLSSLPEGGLESRTQAVLSENRHRLR